MTKYVTPRYISKNKNKTKFLFLMIEFFGKTLFRKKLTDNQVYFRD